MPTDTRWDFLCIGDFIFLVHFQRDGSGFYIKVVEARVRDTESSPRLKDDESYGREEEKIKNNNNKGDMATYIYKVVLCMWASSY